MRVHMLIDSLGSGGAQRQFVCLATGLAARGHTVIARYYHDLDFYRPSAPGLDVACLSGASPFCRKVSALRFAAAGDVDAVISFLDTPNLINCAGALVRPGRLRIVSERNIDAAGPGIRRRATIAAYRMSDWVVSNSAVQNRAMMACGHARKACLIRNMVDLRHFAPTPARIAGRRVLRGVCLASYQPHKNPRLPARWLATDRASPVELSWYGNVASAALQAEYKAASSLSAASGGRMFYHDGSTDARSAYQAHDFLYLPSFYEGTPNVICEAMACGLPIICSRVSDNPEIVQEGVNGFLFDPHDPASFGQAVGKLLALGESARHEMGDRNVARAAELFSPSVFIQKWAGLIETCAR